jgi:FkbM family methyltransferase
MSKYFYDIGANQGQTFDWYLNKRPELAGCHVVCFEPSPRHIPSLLKKMSDPSIRKRYASLTVVVAAIGDVQGLARLYVKTTPLSDSLYAEHTNAQVKNADMPAVLMVPVIRLSKYVLENTVWREEDELFIKIDAEGSEFAILEDLLASIPHRLQQIKLLLVEWHHDKFPALASSRRTKIEAADITRRFAEHGIKIEPWRY